MDFFITIDPVDCCSTLNKAINNAIAEYSDGNDLDIDLFEKNSLLPYYIANIIFDEDLEKRFSRFYDTMYFTNKIVYSDNESFSVYKTNFITYLNIGFSMNMQHKGCPIAFIRKYNLDTPHTFWNCLYMNRFSTDGNEFTKKMLEIFDYTIDEDMDKNVLDVIKNLVRDRIEYHYEHNSFLFKEIDFPLWLLDEVLEGYEIDCQHYNNLNQIIIDKRGQHTKAAI